MTAEIGILNKEAIAIAADSAVTLSRGKSQKIFQSANKIFSLSKYHPIGIMVYGDAELMRIPWETIIKVYREKLKSKVFSTLEDHASHFIDFLHEGNNLFPKSDQIEYFVSNIRGYFRYQIIDEIKKAIEDVINKNKSITKKEISSIIAENINKHYKMWKDFSFNPLANKAVMRDLNNKYTKIIEGIKKNVFELMPLTHSLSAQLTEIALNLFVKSPNLMAYDSGIVIAGFGRKDIFPSIKSFYIDGVVNNRLVYKDHKHKQITTKMDASIIPFAQKDVVANFMEGIEPSYEEVLQSSLSEIFEQYPSVIIDNIAKLTSKQKVLLKKKTKKIGLNMLKKYEKKFYDYQRENFIDPVLRIVAMLPKDELALMAESLVSLTSLKRRVSEEAETVGGPIDVAVISKGDGFIWIKRKHYFKPELNMQFFENYYKKEDRDDKK